jgi:hypothetical protein
MIQAAYLSDIKTMNIHRHIPWQAKLDKLESCGYIISMASKISLQGTAVLFPPTASHH